MLPHFSVSQEYRKIVLLFATMLFFIFVADGLMSYFVPVILEASSGSTFYMGLVMSSSSVAGLLSDFLIAKWFPHKKYYFFVIWLLVFAFLFPLTFLWFPYHTFFFVIAMAAWGIYFEFIKFAEHSFVHSWVPVSEHAYAWGILEIFRSLAYTIAPLLAVWLLLIHDTSLLFFTVLLLCLATCGAWIIKPPVHSSQIALKRASLNRSFSQEIRIWRVLMKKIWPLYFFYFSLILLETGLFTVGVILSEQLNHASWVGGLLLPAYFAPSLLVPALSSRFAVFGKKRVALCAGLLAGVTIALGSLVAVGVWFVLAVFVSSIFSSLAFPELQATFEDYVARLCGFGNDLTGLEASAHSIGYIIGPIIAGALGSYLGPQLTIGMFGGILFLATALGLWMVTGKIKMPQQELLEIVEN